MSSGYVSQAYARCYADWGDPVTLRRSQGFVLRRRIPNDIAHDFMGPYPIFCCLDWNGLDEDLRELAGNGVAVSLVTDPFCDIELEQLKQTFPDRCFAFKRHFVADLALDPNKVVSAHHQREVRRGLRRLSVMKCEVPGEHLGQWCSLYGGLVERHRIRPLLRFSDRSFAALLSAPGVIAFRADIGEETVGMSIWMVHNRVAYWHLAAYSDEGYRAHASYALMWHAWEYFAMTEDWLCLGGTAGTADQNDGLALFKKGWSSGTREVYFCGRVLDHEKYRQLSAGRDLSGYFPAYRSGEFG